MDTAGSERLPGPLPDSDSPQAAPEQRHPGLRAQRCPGGGGQRLQRRTEPGRSSLRAGRRNSGGRGGDFLCPSLLKPTLRLEEREEPRRRHQQVLSDSENEEPITRRIRTISAFIRKTTTALYSGAQRSRSCTDRLEDTGKVKVLLQPALLDSVGALTAGVLLSSENSRSVSVPILPPQRRLAWSAVVPPPQTQSQSERCVPPAAGQSERSASPDSNDSISEELNHFKPIVCSPCTPPKRLADGRTLQPRIIKSTPRNLREFPPSGQTSLFLMQKWRQIELDRQTVSAATAGGGCTVSVATHTSPAQDSAATAMATKNRRRLLFDGEEGVRVKVPAVHFQDHSHHREDHRDRSLDGLRLGPTSKRKRSTKRVEAKRVEAKRVEAKRVEAKRVEAKRVEAKRVEAKRSRSEANAYGKGSGTAATRLSAQERADRALALRLQRRFDSENTPTDAYFLRSSNRRAEKGRGLRSSRRSHKRP